MIGKRLFDPFFPHGVPSIGDKRTRITASNSPISIYFAFGESGAAYTKLTTERDTSSNSL